MDGPLDARLASARVTDDANELRALGCDLADGGRFADAEWCFRRGVELGDDKARFNLGNALADQNRHAEAAVEFATAAEHGDRDALFNLGNSLQAEARLEDAVTAFQGAASQGDRDAWRSLGGVLEQLGDLAGALRAYRAGSELQDAEATVTWAFMLREQDDRPQAEDIMQRAVQQGSAYAAAVLATWRWDRTEDPALEPDLRAGAELYPDARSSLGHLLRATGRLREAVEVLQRGLDADEASSAIPLGNLYADELRDTSAAASAYRRGIELGDAHSHHNLAGLLEDEGQLEEAVNHYRMAAAEGDQLAARALRRLSEDE